MPLPNPEPVDRVPAGIPAVELRFLTSDDLPAVMEIENDSFSTPWRPATFGSLLVRQDADLIGVFADGRLVGYTVCWTIVDQAEIGNVAVRPELRGRGVGRRLVEAALQRVRLRGARECFLEVRESNSDAQSLYLKCGFEVVGRRRRYYNTPVEDALVMRVELP